MINNKSIILLICLLSVFIDLRSEETTPIYSLEECVALALQNNRKVMEAKNDVEAAVTMRKEAFTKYFPEISAAGMLFWANHDILQYNVLGLLELGIINRGKLAGVQALQPVFTGGRIINGNKLAEVGEEVARIRKQQTLDELRLTTETMFWKLVTLKSTKKVVEKAITFLDSLDNQVKIAVEAGLVTRNDLLKVELKKNTYLSDLVDIEEGIKLVKMLLGQYMGKGVAGDIEISFSVPASLPSMPYDLYIPTEQALPLTPDYKLLQKNVDAKNLEKNMTLGGNLPTVAIGGGWYYHNLLGQDNNFGALQVGIEIPVSGWWGGAYSLKRKSLELKNAKMEMEDLSEQLRIGIQDKWNNLTSAYRKMEIEKEGIGQSEENLYLNRMYYEARMTTISELLEAETSRKEAEDRFLSAYGNYRTALSAYLIATGR